LKKALVFLFILISVQSQAQFLEFGGSLGVFNYTGDLNHYPRISKSRPAIGGVYRMNFSHILSLKMGLMVGNVVGDDQKPIDALSSSRSFAFKHQIIEYHSVLEFHFLDYRNDKNPTKWSPYAFMGAGVMKVNGIGPTLEDFNSLQIVLPMGAGVKYMLGKQFTLSGEVGVRKTFFDYLDGVSEGDIYIKDYQFGNPNDDDWYFFTGFSLTYVLYKIPCPFPYVPNKSILTRIRAH
jgi:hypothetical protein